MGIREPEREANNGIAEGLPALEKEATASPEREAYREISAAGDHRLGLLASAYPSGCVLYSVELSLRVLGPDDGVDPARLERAAALARSLRGRGYAVRHLDNGWITAEREVARQDVDAECGYLFEQMRTAAAGGEPA